MQGRAIGPPRRGLALHCGGVPPAQRLAANLAGTRRRRGLGRHMSPTATAGGAGGATPPPRVGRDSGPQAARGGWDAAHRRGRGREPLLPPQAANPSLPDILLSCPGPCRGSDWGIWSEGTGFAGERPPATAGGAGSDRAETPKLPRVAPGTLPDFPGNRKRTVHRTVLFVCQ